MAANRFSQIASDLEIPQSSISVTKYEPSEAYTPEYHPEMKRPQFRTPSPGRDLTAKELKDRIDFTKSFNNLNKGLRKSQRKISDRYKKFVELLGGKCHELEKMKKGPEKTKLTDEVKTMEVRYQNATRIKSTADDMCIRT